MDPHNEPHPEKGTTPSLAPHTSSAAEEAIARDIGSPNPPESIRACAIVRSFQSRNLDEAALQRYAVTPLVVAVATNENSDVRLAATDALQTISPELGRGARNLVRAINQGLTKRRVVSYPTSALPAETPLPYAEQLLVAARWVTESIYQARAYPQNPVRKENGAIAYRILEESFGGKTIQSSVDTLAPHRATLPRDLRDAQEGLDSLAALKVIPHRVHLALRRPSPTELSALDRERREAQVDYLLRSLATEVSYDQATILVLELGRIGDPRSVEALQRAVAGLVADDGGLIAYRNAAQRLDFQRACRLAEKMIKERSPE